MENDWKKYRDKIVGLGEHSLHKSYYPELQEKLEHLEASQKNLETIINSISDTIIIHDIDGRIISLNDKAKQTHNLEGKDASMYTVYDLTSPNQDVSNLPHIWSEVMRGRPQMVEWLGVQLGTNMEMNLQVSISRTNWNGKPALVAVVRDFTERKRFEQQLIEAKEEAERANQLKTEFLQNMSHEVRTPMNGIVGFVEMIAKSDISEEKRKTYSKIIQNSSQQLLKIIDDILEISMLETGQVKVVNEVFFLNDLLLDLYAIFELKSKAKNIELILKKELHNEGSKIVTDKSKLFKILSNLLENALKFTFVGFVELGYKVEPNKVIIYVKDTGIGIRTESGKSIFERFSQEEKGMSKKIGGLGLGLSISKENAQLLGGDISYESEKGKGSTFYLTLPMINKTSIAIGKNSFSDILLSKKVSRYNILVAEDEEVNYLYLEALLEDQYNLYHVRNGLEAVNFCLSNDNIDLILMDIKMPLMNGLEAAMKIKAHSPNVPIIAQTAYSTPFDRENSLANGCDNFISKPINKEELLNLVSRYIGAKE